MFNSGSDPFVNALKSFGYNIVRLPKADIQPLLLLSKNGDNLDRLGTVTKLLTPGETIAAPKITADVSAANLNGSRTGSMKIGLGLSILGNIIGAMGGNMGVEAQYQQAKSAVFEFQSVLQDQIDIVELDQYLGDADINPASVFVSKLLDADKLYVVTATIKSSKFGFEAKTSSGAEVKVNVPVIQQVVGGNVTVGGDSATTSKLTYEGKIPLIFGFQAVQLFFDNGKYTALKPASGAMRAARTAVTSNGHEPELFETDRTFVRLRDL
jgi:hypothetical protein